MSLQTQSARDSFYLEVELITNRESPPSWYEKTRGIDKIKPDNPNAIAVCIPALHGHYCIVPSAYCCLYPTSSGEVGFPFNALPADLRTNRLKLLIRVKVSDQSEVVQHTPELGSVCVRLPPAPGLQSEIFILQKSVLRDINGRSILREVPVDEPFDKVFLQGKFINYDAGHNQVLVEIRELSSFAMPFLEVPVPPSCTFYDPDSHEKVDNVLILLSRAWTEESLSGYNKGKGQHVRAELPFLPANSGLTLLSPPVARLNTGPLLTVHNYNLRTRFDEPHPAFNHVA